MQFFKNLFLFRRTGDFDYTPETLHEKLSERALRPCGALESSTQGWLPPYGRYSPQLAQGAQGHILICAGKEEKILPSSVVNDEVQERSEQIEIQEGRQLRRSEKDMIREEVMTELLPKALTRRQRTLAWIDPRAGWMVVDAGSQKKAEEVTALLRDCLGSLPLVLPKLQEDPTERMTRWFSAGCELPDFEVGADCVLKDPAQEGGSIRINRYELTQDEIKAHLEAGRQADRLSMAWNERVDFTVDKDLQIRRLRFMDLVQDAREDIATENELDRYDADLHIMTHELSQFLPRLMQAMGDLAVTE